MMAKGYQSVALGPNSQAMSSDTTTNGFKTVHILEERAYLHKVNDAFVTYIPPCQELCTRKVVRANLEQYPLPRIRDGERCNRHCATSLLSFTYRYSMKYASPLTSRLIPQMERSTIIWLATDCSHCRYVNKNKDRPANECFEENP